jgi:signal transduction histidine kinase/ligand-binding sensor domain-containing protein
MHRTFKNIIFILTLVFSFPAISQLNTNNLSVYSDLEGAIINDVISDRMGNVWMATGNGLVRFDGYEFKRFYPDPNNPATLGSILTYRLFEDRPGNIWTGCMGLVSEYNPRTNSFKNFDFTGLTDFPIYSQPAVAAFVSDSSGRIYFGVASVLGFISTHALLYKEKNEDEIKRFEYPDSLKIQNIYRFTIDPRGHVWFMAENGLFSIDPERRLHQHKWPFGAFPDDRFHLMLHSDSTGLIWNIAGDAVLKSWDPVTGKKTEYPLTYLLESAAEPFQVNDMKSDSKGNLWIGTSQGLIFFDRQREKFETFEKNLIQKYNRVGVSCLSFDLFGNIWLGTETSGLLRYGNKPVLKSFVFNEEDTTSITLGWVSKIFEDSKGKIWMATSGNISRAGLDEFDQVKQTIIPYPFSSFLPGMEWYNVVGEQYPDQILIQTNLGNFLFNTVTKKVEETMLAPVLGIAYLMNVCRDSMENAWFCTSDGVYLQSKNSSLLRHYRLSQDSTGVSSNEVTQVIESPKYGLWILSNDGLFLYDYKTDSIERHGYDKQKGDVFWSQDINSFYEDSKGVAWVGTWGGGLSRYNIETGKIKTYSTSDGLPSMGVQGILADEKNDALWLSTFEGISRFSIRDEQFNNFSYEDGIQGRLFTDGAYLKTSGGFFVFGGNNGITVFSPDDIARNSTPPKVFITDFRVGNISMHEVQDTTNSGNPGTVKEIALKFKQNNISIDYTGIHYGNPARNKFSYKLENYDSDWREVGTQRTAYYYGLPPGTYKFTVKAANNNGIWNNEGASLSFTILPPWWKSWWAYLIYGIILISVIVLLDRFQRKKVIEKERSLAREKELAQAKEIEKAYHQLKKTQTQLVQSEKMASLGELTAGIAHEIQNPLNFVNNFSEVNVELIVELQQEIEKNNPEAVKSIANDIALNEKKINLHGKRADSIVKGMLQHSRTSNGERIPTDINALADEFLRLSYHGMRAKDKSFNAEFRTEFDPDLPKIKVIPQDISRVVLNLTNNAFYAVSEKSAKGFADYKPQVVVKTKKHNNLIEISIKDNGSGIPESIKDKIFQPFFTTKPTGQGTGLGLSLAYDIVKAHGGELKVETKKGEGAEFMISLPITNNKNT